MNPQRLFVIALSLTAAAGLAAPQPAQAQSNTSIRLNYGSPGGTCNFDSNSGISISGANANIITATGSFDGNSNCPTSGGQTGQANVSIAATPATINPGDSTQVVWSATADVCRFDGSILPGAVSGWQTSGYACIGSSDCAAGGNINPVLNTSGTYSFKLTCYSGAHTGQVQTQDIATAAVTVSGSPPPPNDNCVAPAGLTRATVGTIGLSSGNATYNKQVDVTQWSSVYGFNPSNGDTAAWPGIFNNDLKMTINRGEYWALKFTVGPNFPLYSSTGWLNTYGPYGTWNSNATNTTDGVKWTLSITPDCGDFTVPATSDPSYKCFAEYTNSTSQKLVWSVAPNGQQGAAGSCTLHRGQTYFLNIIPAPMGDPLNNSQQGCNISACKNNLKHTGNFNGTQGM